MANLNAYLNQLKTWYGYNEANGSDDIIIDIYNNQREPGTYKMTHSDPWCHATVSAAAYKSGNKGVVPNTAYCPTGVNWFKARSQWKSRSSGYIPKVGDIVYYDWGYDGVSDHVGTVVDVLGTVAVVREGNKNDRLEDRNISVYSTLIMGYGIPKWGTTTNSGSSSTQPSVTTTGDKYTVKRGDTLTSIAAAYKVTVDQLVKWNNIKDPNVIIVGQVLTTKAPSGSSNNTKPTTPATNPSTSVSPVWIKRLQHELNVQFSENLVEDGIAGPMTLGATVLVQYGARGNITRLIQERVGVTVDGEFGDETKKAVISYQTKNGLVGDGLVGHATWRKLLGM